MNQEKVIVVMPAYNAGTTLLRTYDEIPKNSVDAMILVDDCSQDNTAELAAKLPGVKVIRHLHNLGYGGNQKTCYTQALEAGATIVIMLHPDYQYDPKIIPDMIAPISRGEADVVFASRMLGNPLAGGMPKYKYISNKVLTFIQNLAQGTKLSEFHTGYRAFSRKALESVPFLRNSNDFVFDNEIIYQLLLKGNRFIEIPVTTRYEKDSSTVSFKGSIRYGIGVVKTIVRYLLHRSGIHRSHLFE